MFKVGLKVMMSRHQHTHSLRIFWSQVNTVSSFVFISLQYKANELVQARRLKVPSKSSASAKFSWAAMRMLWKCIVSASNHRQPSSTQDTQRNNTLGVPGSLV